MIIKDYAEPFINMRVISVVTWCDVLTL